MENLVRNSLVILSITLFVVLWANTYTFLYKHTRVKKNISFKLSSLGIPIEYAFSSFITIYYLGFAVIGILLAAIQTHGLIWSIFQLNLTTENLLVILLGIFSAFSLSYFLSDIFSIVKKNDKKQANEIRWVKGIKRFPTGLSYLVTVISSFIEEIFFRGVVLFLIVNVCGLNYLIAGIISFLLFTYAQLKYTDTLNQAMIILNSCITITAVSTVLIAVTHSIIPSMVMHGSFVMFYTFSKDAATKSSM